MCSKCENIAAVKAKSFQFSGVGGASARLLGEVTNNLKDKSDSNATLCKWSEVLTEMTGWWFQSKNVIGQNRNWYTIYKR